MKLIHYTNQEIESLEKRKYLQSYLRFQAKPAGLWFSVEEVECEHNHNWKKWCEQEDFRLEYLSISYEIILVEDANILHLKTKEEIFDFTKKYPNKTRGWDAECDTYELHWDEVKKNYQGIIISPYQWDCRLAVESSWYYFWDCSSGCIWDISCIKEFNLQQAHV